MTADNSAQTEFVVHHDPVWRDRSNFVINGLLQPSDAPYRYEQLWARQIDESRFEICCIPFFVYDLALGDIVAVGSEDGRDYIVRDVVESSGHETFRIWFGGSFYPRQEIADQIQALGSLIEWSSLNLLAVDAVDAEHAATVLEFLKEGQHLGQLVFETGRR